MGTRVYCRLAFGGVINAEVQSDLVALLEDYPWDENPADEINESIESGTSAMFQASEMYADIHMVEECLRENNLAYVFSWSGYGGEFSGGARYWRPGWEDTKECLVDDDHQPAIRLDDLVTWEANGNHNIAALLASLANARRDGLPSLEADDETDDGPEPPLRAPTGDLVTDLWNFIENVTDDDPYRQDKFFLLRERVRESTADAADLKTIRAGVRLYDDALNAKEKVPTADDYNAVVAMIVNT